MKKFFSLVLALVMALSLTTVVFAATTEETALQDALNAGGTVTLTGDVVVEDGLTVPAGKTVVLDLAGYTISSNVATTLSSSFAVIQNEGTLTIKDSGTGGKISLSYGGASFGYSIGLYTISNEGGTLNIEGGTVENLCTVSSSMYDAIDNNSTLGDTVLNISGGNIYCSYIAIRQFANSTTHENIVNVTGGAVEGGNCSIWTQNPNSNTNNADIDIAGGSFTGRILLGDSAAFAASVSGGTFDTDVSAYVAPGYSFVNGQIVASTKTWTDKYFTMTSADATVYDGVTLEYTAPVALTYDADTGLVNNVANVAYYYIPEWNDLYVEVGTIGEADVVAYNTKVDGKATGLFKYLKLVDNVSYIGNGVAFNDFGKACGQYKAVPTVDTKYYLFEDTVYQGVATSDTCLMVGNKLVPVIALPDLFVDHVASYTYNDKFEVTAVKCSECGCVANIVPNYVSLPTGVTGYGPINDTMYYYWPAAAAVVTPSTDKVQSAETFDAGIAMYVGMSVMAAAGSVVVLKKRED